MYMGGGHGKEVSNTMYCWSSTKHIKKKCICKVGNLEWVQKFEVIVFLDIHRASTQESRKSINITLTNARLQSSGTSIV